MDVIEVSAPGKLVLFGEYAVLFGAPAAVVAVDRRAIVTLRPFAGNGWEVAAPGLVAQRARLEVEPDNTVRWHDEKLGRDAFSLIDTLLRGIGDSGSIDLVNLPPLAATLDTRAFFESAGGWESKLGLGSSAALTVAFVSALEVWAGGGETQRSREVSRNWWTSTEGFRGGRAPGSMSRRVSSGALSDTGLPMTDPWRRRLLWSCRKICERSLCGPDAPPAPEIFWGDSEPAAKRSRRRSIPFLPSLERFRPKVSVPLPMAMPRDSSMPLTLLGRCSISLES